MSKGWRLGCVNSPDAAKGSCNILSVFALMSVYSVKKQFLTGLRLQIYTRDTSFQERAHPRESPCHGQQLVPRAHEPHDVRRPLGRQQRRRGRRQEAHLWRVHRRPRGRHVHREGRQITAV